MGNPKEAQADRSLPYQVAEIGRNRWQSRRTHFGTDFMKKLLIASAALSIVGGASAQSSVTLWGTVDATVARGTGSLSDRTRLFSGGLNTSRLGFRGVEDLGGGMKASFWLEATLLPDDGTSTASNTNNQTSGSVAAPAGSQGLTFSRRSTVSLFGPMGELRLGRDNVPHLWNLYFSDVFGNVGVGSAVAYTAAPTGVTNTRASNSIAYWTPSTLGGFGAHLMHFRGENASGAATSGDGNGTSVRGFYQGGPIEAGIAYGKTKYAAGDIDVRNVQASYDFRVAKITGLIARDKVGALNGRGFIVGAVAPVGVNEFKVSYSDYSTDALGEPTSRKLAVGAVHHLSKRTAVYATYARVRNSGGAAHALNAATTAPNASSSGYDLGLRHSF